MFFDNETIVSLPTPYLKLIGAYIYANMNFRIGIGRNISYRPIYWILYSFMNLYSKIQIQVYYNFFLYFNFSELLFTKGIFFLLYWYRHQYWPITKFQLLAFTSIRMKKKPISRPLRHTFLLIIPHIHNIIPEGQIDYDVQCLPYLVTYDNYPIYSATFTFHFISDDDMQHCQILCIIYHS